MKGDLKGNLKLCREIILGRFGLQKDFVGYETLIDYINKSGAHKLEGDMLEIGAFMGGGSRKIAHHYKRYGKRLFVIDVFNPNFDRTENNRGQAMDWIYNKILGNKDLKRVFDKNTKDERNITVYHKDSKEASLPDDTKLFFSFVDGNHDPEYVEHDFNLAWYKTVPEGIVSLHDYGGDLPQVTQAIHKLINKNLRDIAKIEFAPKKNIIFIHKKGAK